MGMSSEERLRILKWVKEGKIGVEEAVELLDALESNPLQSAAPEPAETPQNERGPAPGWMRVRVTDTDTGKVRVNVRLPLNVVNTGLKLGMRISQEVEGLNIDDLMRHIQAGDTGQIADIFDEEDGERVEVFLE